MSFANSCPAIHSEGGLLSKDDKEHGDVDHDDDFDDDDGGDDVNDENYDGDMRQAKRMASTIWRWHLMMAVMNLVTCRKTMQPMMA